MQLPLSEIDAMTKNMGKTLLNVNFTGGEPFARKDIVEIAKLYIKNTTIQSIYITTLLIIQWCPQTELNRQPTDYKSVALPIEL